MRGLQRVHTRMNLRLLSTLTYRLRGLHNKRNLNMTTTRTRRFFVGNNTRHFFSNTTNIMTNQHHTTHTRGTRSRHARGMRGYNKRIQHTIRRPHRWTKRNRSRRSINRRHGRLRRGVPHGMPFKITRRQGRAFISRRGQLFLFCVIQ